MATSSFTQEQIDDFERTLVDRKGVVFATFGDQQMSFTSYEDAMTFLAEMRRQLTAQEAAAAGRSSSTRYAATSKGV